MFRGHIRDGAYCRTRTGKKKVVGGGLIGSVARADCFADAPGGSLLGQSKIENFCLAAGGDENIRGLDVAVNDAASMGRIKRIGNLRAEIEQGIGGHGPAADAFTERLTFEDLHDQIGAPIVLAHVVNRANGRMIQRRGGTSLALEPLESRRIAREFHGKKFERDLTTQTRVFRAKDLSHAATAERIEDAVVRNCFANHVRKSS